MEILVVAKHLTAESQAAIDIRRILLFWPAGNVDSILYAVDNASFYNDLLPSLLQPDTGDKRYKKCLKRNGNKMMFHASRKQMISVL